MKDKPNKPARQRSAHAVSKPHSGGERVEQRPTHGERCWFDIRREARPARGDTRAAGGVLLPQELLLEKSLFHDAFVPDEASRVSAPHIVGRPTARPLRRFGGGKVTPVNATFLDGNDDRQIFYDASYPWATIGRIVRPDGGWGTATIAGENFIITASHVVAGLWTPGQPLAQTITFVPAMFDGVSILGPSWTANVTGIAAWREISDVVGYDVAICQLDKPLGDWLGYFGSRSYDEGWEDNAWWEHVGYPYDMSPGGNEPCWQRNITINDDDNDDFDTVELETDADVASGQSGGPLWAVFENGGPQVIGVLSGNENGFWETSNIFAGGNGLNSLVKWGRQHWR